MKKIILGGALCFIFSNTFADYVRTTNNGGAHGYNETKKEVTGGNTVIDCKDPGYEACPTISYNSSEQPAINFAIAKIAMGTLSGSEIIEGHTVRWSSDDTVMTNSTISVTAN